MIIGQIKDGIVLDHITAGRGMDISELRYRGVPIAYLTKAGVGSAALYDPVGDGWLKNFFAGMLTTCGLSNAGPACKGDLGLLRNVPLGLHGGISNTPADNVCTREEWKDGSYRMTVSGRMEGPGLFEMLELLGRDRTVARLRRAAAAL